MMVTRRINRPDGSFAGVAYASVNTEYFSSFYRQVDLGRLGIVSLVGRDGIVRARLSSDGVGVGMNIGQTETFERWRKSDFGNLRPWAPWMAFRDS
jgi:hypothetical protein